MLGRTLLDTVTPRGAAANGFTRRIVAAAAAAATQPRTFATTSRRDAKHITKFTPTSSPELDRMLEEMRQKVILPSFLPEDQRKKLHNPKYEQQLKSDPITIEIDGEILKFYHLDMFKDLPARRPLLSAIVRRLETDKDFENLQPLLEGLHQASCSLNAQEKSKLTRIICSKGHLADLITCAQSVKRTGFKLDMHEVVTSLLMDIQLRAASSGWDKATVSQCQRWSELILEMLESEDHAPGPAYRLDVGNKNDPSHDAKRHGLPLQRDPVVLLGPLHLAAAAGNVEKTTKLAKDIIRAWPANKQLTEVQPPWQYTDKSRLRYLKVDGPSKTLRLLAPLALGLQRAIAVVEDGEVRSELQTREQSLKQQVEGLKNQLESQPTDKSGMSFSDKEGYKVYQQLFGSA